MPKRNKTYSLDDVSIEMVREMEKIKIGDSQSSILNDLVLAKAAELAKNKSSRFEGIRKLVRIAQQQYGLLL